MGRTHALSAVAVFLGLFAFLPSVYARISGGRSDFALLAMLCLVASGGALLPDLDNTASTAKSNLGIVGTGISSFMRTTSPIIQGAISTKYDRKGNDLDAHRGFYHTFLSGILSGALFAFLCSPALSFRLGGLTVDGKLVSLFLMFISVDLALSAILGKIWSSKKAMDTVASLLLSFGISWVIWMNLKATDYTIIGLALGAGWIIHIIGDMFTVDGAPALFPIKIHGKFWYDIRFLRIRANGTVENMVFTPLFILIIVVSIIHILLM